MFYIPLRVVRCLFVLLILVELLTITFFNFICMFNFVFVSKYKTNIDIMLYDQREMCCVC